MEKEDTVKFEADDAYEPTVEELKADFDTFTAQILGDVQKRLEEHLADSDAFNHDPDAWNARSLSLRDTLYKARGILQPQSCEFDGKLKSTGSSSTSGS